MSQSLRLDMEQRVDALQREVGHDPFMWVVWLSARTYDSDPKPDRRVVAFRKDRGVVHVYN